MDKKVKLVNFYEKIDKKLLLPQKNPHFDIHGLKIPYRLLLCGSSGSYKTGTLLNIIKTMNDTFDKIVIISKNLDEPLYKWLRAKISEEQGLYMYEGLENTPPLDSWNNKENNLIIFDDMQNEKNLKPVSDQTIIDK